MKKISLSLLSLLFIFPFIVNATDGYFMLGFGTRSKGMGGTGVAYYQNSIIGGNPAGNSFLGTQYSLALDFFLPDRRYNVTGNPSGVEGTMPLATGEVISDTKILFIPSFGANWAINKKSAFGISFYGSGLNTNYPAHTFYDESVDNTGINILQVFANPTYSLKLGEKHSIGASAILAYQQFKAEGLSMFGMLGLSSNPDKLTNNDNDSNFGVGFKLGYMGEIMEGLTIGASYQSRVNASEFTEYAGLFAEGGSFDIPANWTAGLNYSFTDKVRVLFDVQQIYYSKVKSIANPMSKLFAEGQLLGSDDGPGFGWNDMTIFKLGTEISASESLQLRAGFAHGKQPVDESEVLFNILAPGVIENHLTLGLSKYIGTNGKSIDFAFVHAFNNSVTGPNPLDPAQEIEISMKQFEFEIAFTF